MRLIHLRSVRFRCPQSMSALHCLGFVLAWTRTRGSEMVLCTIFGVIASVYSLSFRFRRRLFIHMLSRDANADVEITTPTKKEEYKAAITAGYSQLKDIYSVADENNMHLEQPGDTYIQNRFYNGWKHDHYVINVLVFPCSC